MLTIKEIKALKRDETFKCIVVLKKKTTKSSPKCPEFLNVEFADKTGNFSVNIFKDKMLEDFRKIDAGTILIIDGKFGLYNEKFSPAISAIAVVPESERPNYAEAVVAVSPENFDEMKRELAEIIAKIPNDSLRAVTQNVIDELGNDFLNSPAAVFMHQAYCHGLLEHSLHLARVALALLPQYPFVDPSLAIAGALLHDVGKVLEYTQDLMATQRTRLGILQGHVVLGYRIVRRACIKNGVPADLQERLEHIVLSHQGKLEWGAAVLASTPEAVFISQIDDFDAKMAMVRHALDTAVAGTEFSDKIPGLDNATLLLTKPETGENANGGNGGNENMNADGNADFPPDPDDFNSLGDLFN